MKKLGGISQYDAFAPEALQPVKVHFGTLARDFDEPGRESATIPTVTAFLLTKGAAPDLPCVANRMPVVDVVIDEESLYSVTDVIRPPLPDVSIKEQTRGLKSNALACGCLGAVGGIKR